MKQLPIWNSSQFAGEVVKAAQKIKDLGGQEPTMAQQREALLGGLLPVFGEFVRSLRLTQSFCRELSLEETVAKLREFELSLSENGKVTDVNAFLGDNSSIIAEKHCAGFSRILVLVPRGIVALLNMQPLQLEEEYKLLPLKIRK